MTVHRPWAQFSSVTQSCPTLCYPLDCCKPGFPVFPHLPELAQTHCLLSQWCHPTISSSVIPFSSCLQSFPGSGPFLMSQLFASVGQSIEVQLQHQVLPVNFQGWFLWGWTVIVERTVESKSGQTGYSAVLADDWHLLIGWNCWEAAQRQCCFICLLSTTSLNPFSACFSFIRLKIECGPPYLECLES